MSVLILLAGHDFFHFAFTSAFSSLYVKSLASSGNVISQYSLALGDEVDILDSSISSQCFSFSVCTPVLDVLLGEAFLSWKIESTVSLCEHGEEEYQNAPVV